MKIQDVVRRLVGQIPLPDEEDLPPGVSDRDLEGFTRRTGLPVPPELQEWLRFTNGLILHFTALYGLRPTNKNLDLERVFGYLPVFRENQWLPIANDGCGNYSVLALNSVDLPLRPVYFIDPYQEGGYAVPTYVEASGLWQFLWGRLLKEKGDINSLFEAKRALARDPDLKRIRSAPLPWRADKA